MAGNETIKRTYITKANIEVVKVRLFLVLAALFVVSYRLSAYSHRATSSPEIIATPTPTATLTPSQPDRTTISVTKLTDDIEVVEKNATKVVFILVKVLAALLSLLIIDRIILLIFYRSSQLIIDNFTNASADELDKVLPGLSQLARERLVREMKGVRQRVKQHIITQGPENYRPPDKFALPQSTSDQRLADLVASLNEFTPDQIDPVVHMLKVIFPPYGTKVTSILQSQGKEYDRLGITFEITNIEGRLSSKLYTIWESLNDNSVASQQALKDRYRALLKSAIRWLALELCRREMVAAVPWNHFGGTRDRYQAKIYNFFGALNQASAPTHGKLFYELRI